MPVRRNQAFLTIDEKVQYARTVLELKRRGLYDRYVTEHAEISYYAHGGPSFLPWHRHFLWLFEQDLQSITPGLTIPYWDWTVDRSPTSSIWGSGFMGPNGEPGDGQVLGGPFAYRRSGWTCITAGGISVPPYLRRRFGPDSGLPTTDQVNECLAQTPYDGPPWNSQSEPSFRNFLEGVIHNPVHGWVGGNMAVLSSPNDPVFFVHHCSTDRLWALWQQWNPDSYQPKSGGPQGQNQPDLMYPWDGSGPDGSRVSIADVLDHRALGYVYDTEWPTAEGNRMLPGDVLRSNDWITSANGMFALWYDPAGNVRVTERGGTNPVWQTTTAAPVPNGIFVMEVGGDLVLYDNQGKRAWHSGTTGEYGNRRLYLANDGVPTMVDLNGNTVWTPWSAVTEAAR